jgi:hypothetical protein
MDQAVEDMRGQSIPSTLIRLVQRSQAHDAVKLLSVMRVLAKAVIIALADSDLIEDKPGVIKVPFAGGVAVVELPAPGELILVKTVLPLQETA